MEINWNAFFLVFAASVGFSFVIVLAFSLGVRLFTNAETNKVIAKKKGSQSAAVAELWNRSGAYAMFSVAAFALLYGIYLIVPYFHPAA